MDSSSDSISTCRFKRGIYGIRLGEKEYKMRISEFMIGVLVLAAFLIAIIIGFSL